MVFLLFYFIIIFLFAVSGLGGEMELIHALVRTRLSSAGWSRGRMDPFFIFIFFFGVWLVEGVVLRWYILHDSTMAHATSEYKKGT